MENWEFCFLVRSTDKQTDRQTHGCTDAQQPSGLTDGGTGTKLSITYTLLITAGCRRRKRPRTRSHFVPLSRSVYLLTVLSFGLSRQSIGLVRVGCLSPRMSLSQLVSQAAASQPASLSGEIQNAIVPSECRMDFRFCRRCR